jgi:hypothetical protein
MADEQKPKQVVEWSFSFDKVGESLNKALGKLSGDEEVKSERFSVPVEGTRSARVQLSLSVGMATVQALNGSDNLIQADVKYTGEMEFTTSGEAEKTVKLAQKRVVSVVEPIRDAIAKFSNRDDLRWDVGLSPEVALDLDIDGGVGQNTLDLTGLRLTAFRMDGGVGETRLTLPATSAAYNADLNGGVGGTTITVADGAAVRLRIKGGVGGVTLHLPEGAAARIELNGGLGGANFAPRFTRTKGGDDFISKSGTWETAGYSLAAQQVYVQFEGGVGGLKVV